MSNNEQLQLALAELEKRREQALSGASNILAIENIDAVKAAIGNGIKRELIEDWDSDIWDSVAEGDLRAVCEYLLENNVRVNRLSVEYSPMMLAVWSGNIEIVRSMLRHGWDPNEWTDVDWDTPLTLAAYKGFGDIFFLLVESGAKLHMVGYDHELIDYGRGCDVNGERFDITPSDLMCAALVGQNERICRFLDENLEDREVWPHGRYIPWHLFDEKTREFCLASGIDLLITRFVPVLDKHLQQKKS